MISKINNYLKDQMIRTLVDCHEKELWNLPPCNAVMTPSAKGLISRGVLPVKNHLTESAKRITAVYVTDKGKTFIQIQ